MEDKVIYKSQSLSQEIYDELSTLKKKAPSPLINADYENVEKGLAKLVLTLIHFLKTLLERQAVTRMENGRLSLEEVERIGETFMKLDEKLEELRIHFQLEKEDLNLDLGPLGDLM